MLRLFILATMFSALIACASAPSVPAAIPAAQASPEAVPAASAEPEEPELPERAFPADSIYSLLVAEFALRRHDYPVALENYTKQAQQLDDIGLRAHTTHLAQFMQDEEAALGAARLWVEIDPDNLEVNNTLATLLARRGLALEALPHLAAVSRGGQQAQYPILLNGFRKLDPDRQNKLAAAIGELGGEFPDDTQLILTRALLQEELGQQELALDTIRTVFPLEPYQNQAVLLEAKLLVSQDADEPFTRMLEALAQSPQDNRLRLQYARLLTRSDMSAAREQFEILSAQSPRDGDLLFSLALINRETGDTLAAKAYLRQMLELEQRLDDGYYYLGRIAEEEGELESAVANYMKVEEGGDFFSANNRIGRILINKRQTAQFRAYINQLRDDNPDKRAQLYGLEVDLLTKAGDLEIGMAVLNTALEEFPESTALRYTRSMVGEQQDNLALMESDLRTIIALEPDNATALNALGYSLANRTERYDEALALIASALALQPEEPAILDSMGWVLYRQGSYQEALEYLSRAYIKFPDPEVAAHLGEVLWVTGETEAAVDVWRGALLKAPDHKILTETLKRLGVPDLGAPD